MKLNKLARKINRELFDGLLNLDHIRIISQREIMGCGDGIAGMTYAFKTEKYLRISVIYILTKHCKGKRMTYRVLMHEMVHAYQNQLKQKMNHNGAFFHHFERKARALGYEIDMARF